MRMKNGKLCFIAPRRQAQEFDLDALRKPPNRKISKKKLEDVKKLKPYISFNDWGFCDQIECDDDKKDISDESDVD